MAQPYPPNVISRAKQLWCDVGATPTPTFDSVAKALKKEFGLPRLTRKTVHEWCQQYGWAQPKETALVGTPPPAMQMVAPSPVARDAAGLPTQPADEETEFDWERRRLQFLAKLAGVAETCLAMDVDETGVPVMRFRDDDSRFKTGFAAVELLGKINSGKFDPPEIGDHIPQLSKQDVRAVIAFFIGSAPEPRLGRVVPRDATQVIEGTLQVMEDSDADSDGQATAGNETRRLQISDR